jgi:hypothetical protein
VTIAHQSATVTTTGALKVKLICSGAPGSGTLKLMTLVKKTTGSGKKKKTTTTTVKIGAGSFSRLKIGAHRVSLKLNRTGLRLLRQDGDKLSSTAKATYKSGSKTKTASAAVSLKGAR